MLQRSRFGFDLSQCRFKLVPSQWQPENAEDYLWWVALNSKPFFHLVERKNRREVCLRAIKLEGTNFKPLASSATASD